MKLSKKSEYGLRALLELTLVHGKATLQRHDIADRQHIPVEFLEQILLTLKRAGIISSRRGVNGGYVLIKQPNEITLGQVIRILDGPLAPIGCVSKTAYQKCSDCPYANKTGVPSNKSWARSVTRLQESSITIRLPTLPQATPRLTLMDTTVLVLITFVAATVNGALGYGFSSITVPVALLFYTNRILNPALVLIELVINGYVLFMNRDSASRISGVAWLPF